MNNKLLIGFLVFFAGLLLLPIAAGVFKSARPAATPVPAAVPATDSEWEPDPAATEAPAEETMAAPHPAAFQFTAETLVNTAWQVQTAQGQVEVELLPGNQARASHPMVGSINGTWRVNGNGLTVTASYMGHTQTISCFIEGDQLIYEGYQIRRLR